MDSRLDAFEAIFSKIILWLAACAAASIGLFAILIPLNLLLVNAQWGNLWWLYEAVEYTLYVGVFIGAPWVMQQGAHVRVDVLISALPKPASAKLEKCLDVAGGLLCLVLCFYGTRAALLEFADGTLPDKDLRIENGYMMTVFAGSFLLLAIEFLLRFRRAHEVLDKEKTPRTGAGF